MMKYQLYSTPVIPPDLRSQESILQIADSLDYLDKIANDIFTRITNRVAENRQRLQAIKKRSALAQAKIDKLKGSNKATKVFCSAKYPGSDKFDYYKSLFATPSEHSEIQRSAYKIMAKHPNLDDKALKEKLHFYNLRWTVSRHEHERVKEEGLGRLPRGLKSISSLLLFNTAENPYQKYVIMDPLRAVSKMRKVLESDDEGGMGAAPLSILHREQLEQQVGENYFYSPGLGHVPEIDVPMDLPDLPGIADDLTYSADIGPTIAPSVPIASLPALPEVIPDLPSPGTFDILPAVAPPSAPPPPAPPVGLPPPPPPPPDAFFPAPSTTPAPPPPPPPPAAEEPTDPAASKPKEGAPTAVTNPGDARSNLLESIRQAGGKAKLRGVVQDRKNEAKKKKQEEKVSGGGGGGGDLMSDLFAKLSMRRKGISGTRATGTEADGPSVGAGSAMDRISAMIPPPPKPEQAKEQHSDEDWE